ncbi:MULTISPECIES: hypothetical protein [unclassified Oceanispirochaeta]|uniref:hypothetical protein n=1 Tax=unclassified Oceanispirochaeta TaxID=2635722 RepID=UPI000E098F35|nr:MULTISPECIES: hypothetical protein [unclassified Oceanispirochaeta]MBF9017162.1 hypothetical protein [Oceanispirochaeta sp. M2]NPD73611.1 hypothetical protein [Oceanispirochaeta sp. M1]RDG30714.1 hypothetical protein DV872_16070 [Oceanispirochaeta sp. M1]
MSCKSAGIHLIFFLMFPAISIFSQTSFLEEAAILEGASFHENIEVRSAMTDTINAPFYSLLARQKEIHSQILSPVAVEFELRKSEDSFYLLYKNELDYKYPVWGRGNYIIKRDLRTGEFLQIKIFLQNDEMSYIRLFPLGEDRSSLELSLYGMTLYSGIVLPVSIEDLSVSSFARIMFLSKGTIRWDQIFTDAFYPEWRSVAALQSALRNDMGSLFETEDGGMDSDGNFAFIKDGSLSGEDGGVNCSGFAKWVADGILLSRGAETLLDFESLKVPTETESRKNNPWSSARVDRDPYFGLDWCRNIAVALRLSEPGGSVDSPLDMDVKTVPFFDYKDNVGYRLDKVKTLLYLQAVKEPGSFYLGTINSLYGEDPALWQYHHVALFFPWFDENGDFHLEVLETGTVSSVENLKYRYPQSYLHLSKAKASDYISPWPSGSERITHMDSVGERLPEAEAEDAVEIDTETLVETFAR